MAAPQQQYSDLPPGAVVLHAPSAPQYSDLPAGATVVSTPKGDLTSNPNGEGTYKMVGRKGPADIPFSNVEDAKAAGYKPLSQAEIQRYNKDLAATKHPIMDAINSAFANNPGADQPGGSDEALRPIGNIGRRAVRTIASSIATLPSAANTAYDAIVRNDPGAQRKVEDWAGGQGEYGASALASRGKEAVDTAKTQGVTQAATDLAGDAAAMYATGKALEGVTGALVPKVAEVVKGQNYTPEHAAAFEGAIAPATAMGKNFVPQSVTPEALTPLRATAARMEQGTPVEQGIVQTVTSPKTPPLERIAAYQKLVQTTLSDLESQHAPALAAVAKTPVDTTPIVQRLQSRISPTMDPADVSAIRNLMMRVQRAKTLGDLNTFRGELNDENAPAYKMSQVQQGRTGVSAKITDSLADWVRNAYYDNLETATGTDFAPLKRQEANLLTTQESLQNQQSSLARAEATYNAPSTLKETAGNMMNVIKDPKTTVTQTFLRESPATKVSSLLRKSLDDLPAHTPAPAPPAPPSQVGAPPTQPALGRPPVPTVQGTPVNPAPGTAPNPGPNSNAQLSPFRQLEQLRPGSPTSQLPTSTGGYNPTPSSPPPPFNPNTARTRVQPIQPARPVSLPLRGTIAVDPEGGATLPAKGLLPAPEANASTPKALTGKALWAQRGAEKLATHGVSAADIDALAKTQKGKQLLVIASALSPNSPSMKNLVKQISGLLR